MLPCIALSLLLRTLLTVLRRTATPLVLSLLLVRSNPGPIIQPFQPHQALDPFTTLPHPRLLTCLLLALQCFPSTIPLGNFSANFKFCSTIDYYYSSGSSGGGSIRHTLAASGSGSESEIGVGNMSNHAANLSISNHPTNHSNLTLSNHPTNHNNMNNYLTEPPSGPPPLPPGGNFMIPQSGM